MDERRDLVDREELRRRIKANESAYDAWSYRNAMHLLDTMPSVECPRGWTRDEVLAELDAAEQRGDEAVCKYRDPIDGRWWKLTRHAVETWHPEVRRYDVRVVLPEPPVTVWVPLHEVIGRVPVGHNIAVRTVQYRRNPDGWIWSGPEPHGGSHLKVVDGRVEVLAEGDA